MNSETLRQAVRERVGRDKTLCLLFGASAEEATFYFDLSGGPIHLDVGGRGGLKGLWLEGAGCQLVGIGPNELRTPLFAVSRAPGSYPIIELRNLDIQTQGSGLSFLRPGTSTRCENCQIEGRYGGVPSTEFDFDTWDDLDTAPYGLKVEDADGMFVSGFSALRMAGHGVVAKRWHAGAYQGRVRECAGSGLKWQQVAGVNAWPWCESNEGWGLDARNCDLEVFDKVKLRSGSASDRWPCWFEANNGRGTPYTRSWHTFPQFRLQNCDLELLGHTGWNVNAGIVDSTSRELCRLEGEGGLPATQSDLSLARNIADLEKHNFALMWPDVSLRPTITKYGDGRLLVEWPARSFQGVRDPTKIAWWNPWPSHAVLTPGGFAYAVTVQALDDRIPDYCRRRFKAGQTPIVGAFVLQPVGAAIRAFTLWDTKPRTFVGQAQINQPVALPVSIGFNAWVPGMGDRAGDPRAQQTEPLEMAILEMDLWKL